MTVKVPGLQKVYPHPMAEALGAAFAVLGSSCEKSALAWFSLVAAPRTRGRLGTPRGALRAQNIGCLRIYGFQGEAAEEGEGFTRIRESSYRRI